MMPASLRCFLAVRVPAHPALEELIRELGDLGGSVRGVDPAGIHSTLKFLGDTRPEDVSPICEELRAKLANRTSCKATIRALGVFPSVRLPRVVWAGVEPAEPLRELAQVCEEVCQPFGYPGESRGFQPHITLARVAGRPPDGLAEILEHHSESDFGSLPLSYVELIRSNPGRDGPEYTTLAKLPLGGE